ncbi:hypothetical protein ILYODFUR_001990 [Ilyodon furcidens]|uniref:Uncharacterized protein n=1 Tax=Ilyodon furcidens TaxID=33524 RepID=A0ABV0UCL3_9TELE
MAEERLLDILSCKLTSPINYPLKTIIFLICLLSHLLLCCLHLLLLLFTYLSVFGAPPPTPPPSLPPPYGCRSNNVKHFALASFCNLQFPNVRPVESRSDNGHALPPGVFSSHHISLQLMLQREFHVITLALLSCPHERGKERETEEEPGREWVARGVSTGGEKQLKLGQDGMARLCNVVM